MQTEFVNVNDNLNIQCIFMSLLIFVMQSGEIERL